MLDRAARAGVHTLLTVGVDVLSSTRAVALAQQYWASHGVVAAVGLHPAFLHADMTLSHETIKHSIGSIAQLAQAELGREERLRDCVVVTGSNGAHRLGDPGVVAGLAE